MSSIKVRAKPILRWLALIFCASIAVFTVGRLMPTTPMERVLAAQQLPATSENLQILREQWHLDRPLVEQYFTWIYDFIHGNWGTSLISGQHIKEEFLSRVPYSITIGLGGIFLASVLAYFIGSLAGRKGGGWELLSRTLAVLGQTVPAFIAAAFLVYYLGVVHHLRIFTGSHFAAILCAIGLVAFYSTGELSRIVANHVREIRMQPYIDGAVARGYLLDDALRIQGRRPVVYGLLAALVAKLSWVIGGTTIVEFVFTIPGLSYFVIQSIQESDYHVIQSFLMVLVIWMLLMHIILNILMKWLDPRTRS